jgi:chromosome segregation ATPase
MSSEVLAGIIAALISFVSLVGYKIVDKRLGKGERKEASKIEERNYLKDELSKLWKRVDALDDDIVVWREKYYKAQDSISELRVQVESLTEQVATLKVQLIAASTTRVTSTVNTITNPAAPGF